MHGAALDKLPLMHLAIAILVVVALARIAYVVWRRSRTPKPAQLTPDWRPEPPKPKQRRSVGRVLLLSVLLDPVVVFLALVVLAYLFGPFRPVHEWMR
jgi:hypothetical protein